MTAHVLQGDRKKCLEAGMDDYSSKPIKSDAAKHTLEPRVSQNVKTSEESTMGDAPQVPPGPPVLDVEEALARVGEDREFLAELVETFLEEYPALISAIQAAVTDHDPKALRFSAHTLKGSVGNFGAKAVFDAACVLEIMGRQGELSGAPAALAALEQELARLQPALAALKLEPTA
jgi:HPt (histidine-containing phosphotransfer) domain-containing protein